MEMKFELNIGEKLITVKEGDILFFKSHNEGYVIFNITKKPLLSRVGEIVYCLCDDKGCKQTGYNIRHMNDFLKNSNAEIYDGGDGLYKKFLPIKKAYQKQFQK